MSDSTTDTTEELVEFNGKQVYPEVAQYFTTYRQAERAQSVRDEEISLAWNRAVRDARWQAEDEGRRFDQYNDATLTEARNKDRTDRAAMQAEYERATTETKDLLLKSPHPEVAWIAKEILFKNSASNEHKGHARSILKMLPASTDELWRAAKDDYGMCEVFDSYYESAEAAGVLTSKDDPFHGMRQLAALRNYIRRSYGGSYVRDFMSRLDPVLKEIKARHDQELADAKAEWQRLDEAYRSNGARKAAATRAARRGTSSDADRRAEQDAPAVKAEVVEDEPEVRRSVISTQSALTGETFRTVLSST